MTGTSSMETPQVLLLLLIACEDPLLLLIAHETPARVSPPVSRGV
jgi:hypothetical protein